MTNTNCLENIKCPSCGNEESFRIAAKTMATVTDDGVEDHTEMEWDDDSYADCTKCCWHGALKDFTVRSDPGAGGEALAANHVSYTPGPWACDLDYIVAADPNGRHPDIYIAEIAESDEEGRVASHEQQLANRQLITAAPAQALMLDLSRYGLISLADGDAEFNGTVYAFDHMQPDWEALIDAIGWDTARTAIAKATAE